MNKLSIRKVLGVTLAVLLVVCISLLTFYFVNCYQANKLVDAILEDDFPKVERIVEKYPHCIDLQPTISPDWWLSLMETYVYFPMEVACARGNTEIIRCLVEHGVNVNTDKGVTPLNRTLAIKPEGWHDTFYYLIDHGADLSYVTYYGTTAVEDAVRYKYCKHDVDIDEVCDVVRYLLKHGAPNKNDVMDALCRCAEQDSRSIPVMEILMEEGHIGVNDKGWKSNTPLMYAAAYGDVETVEYLLSCGADVDAVDDDGETAIDWAERNGRTDILLLLKGHKEAIPD